MSASEALAWLEELVMYLEGDIDALKDEAEEEES